MNTPLRDRTQGQWPGLLAAAGIDSRYLSGKHGPCPICKDGRDRFRFDNKDGRGTWICSKCGAGDGISLLMQFKGLDFKETADFLEQHIGSVPAQPPRAERSEKSLRDAMNRIWSAANPVVYGDAVARYLESRGIALDEYPRSLRFAESIIYQGPPASRHPAMLAKVSGPDGRPITVHRTYLSDHGGKAAVDAPRRLMPGKVVHGSAVRLAPAGEILGIAEGIETALSAAAIWRVPCWAAVNAAMLMAWQPPDDVAEIIVFADNDVGYAGQSAAFALAHRLASAKRKVRVEMPADPGLDWNDVLMAEKETT